MDAAMIDAIAKLSGVVLTGMGGLGIVKQALEPWQTKRMARAEVEKKKILAQGDLDVMKLNIDNRRAIEDYEASSVILTPAENPVEMKLLLEPTIELAEIVEHETQRRQARRLDNVQKVAAVAAEELQGQTASAEPVDDSWTSQFFDAVKDVSQEDMQRLWGKILAGEVRKPGSFSIRSIEVVRQLSRQEAQLFQMFASYVVNDLYIFNNSEILGSGRNSLLGQAIVLAEAGLLVADTGLSFNKSFDPKGFLYLTMSTVGVSVYSNVATQLSVGTYVLSTVGGSDF